MLYSLYRFLRTHLPPFSANFQVFLLSSDILSKSIVYRMTYLSSINILIKWYIVLSPRSRRFEVRIENARPCENYEEYAGNKFVLV